MPASSRYAETAAAGGMVLRERPVPAPGPGELLVHVEYCGVCSSDLGYLRHDPEPGRRLGHEVVGQVLDGNGLVPAGRYAVQTSEGFSNHVIVRPAALVPLPEGIDSRLGALAEPVACSIMAADRSVRLAPPTRALLVGAGFMGLVIVRLLAARGIAVTAVDPLPAAREAAVDQGAAIAALPDDLPAESRFPLVIECVGSQEALDVAVRHVDIGGLLSIVGYHQSRGGTRKLDLRALNFRGVDIVNAHERDEATIGRAMERALVLMKAGMLDGFSLMGETLALPELPTRIDALGTRKHLVDCRVPRDGVA